MKLKAVAKSDIGKNRENNEDSYFCDPSLGLFIVCDGMGGHAAGETASRRAVEIISEKIAADIESISIKTSEEIKEYLAFLVNDVCKNIYRLASTVQNYAGMGTTLTMILINSRRAYMAHVGDSRVYLSRSGKLSRLSNDHTLLAAMEEQGGVVLPDGKNSPYANILTRCVGKEELVQVDTLSFDLLPEDRLLLCSDGLSSAFDNDQHLSSFLSSNLDESLSMLVETALQLDGSDNITGVSIYIPKETLEAEHVAEVKLKYDVLKQVYLFKSLSLQEAAKVLEIVTIHDFDQDQVLMREGEKGELFYMILNGKLDVSRNAKHLATLETGSHIGEISFLANISRSATVKAIEKSRLMAIRTEDFRLLINEDRKLGNKLLWSLAEEIGVKLAKASEPI